MDKRQRDRRVVMSQAPTMKRYYYSVMIDAEDQEQADTVFWSRIGHDEDLREDGVEDYTIDGAQVEDLDNETGE
jgi:hypothetical protein